MDSKYYTPQELADLLGVKLSTIYNWSHIKFLPTTKIGKVIRFRKEAIDKWLLKRESNGRLNRKTKMKHNQERSNLFTASTK